MRALCCGYGYSAVLMPDKGLKERLSSDASDRCAY
jgi:hypothetical protein